jgi:hypothetical protein
MGFLMTTLRATKEDLTDSGLRERLPRWQAAKRGRLVFARLLQID